MQSAGDLQEPDRRELDRLVTEHLPTALRFAVKLTGSLDAAEDALQEALLRVTTYWSGFRKEAAFRSWLYRIIVNVVHDGFGRRAKTVDSGKANDATNSISLPDRQAGPSEHAVQREFGELIAQCVSQLPSRQRAVLVLITYEGCTADEAAEILQITTANVHSTLHVARARLKEQLSPYLQAQC